MNLDCSVVNVLRMSELKKVSTEFVLGKRVQLISYD